MRSSLLLIVLFYSSFVSSQETKLITRFKHLEVKDGLPENDVKGYLSDADNGYWFRTTNYIVYYNGHDFISYGREMGLHTMENHEIRSFNLHKDHIYVFGSGGVDRINCVTKKVEKIFRDTIGLGIKAGYFSRKGHLILVSKKGEVFELIRERLKKIHNIQLFSYCEITETKEGHILISNVNKNISIFSEDIQLLNDVRLPEPTLLSGDMKTFGNIGTWASANKRILIYDPIKFDFDLYKVRHPIGRLFLKKGDQNFVVSGFNKITEYDLKLNRSNVLNISLNYNYYINFFAFDKNQALVLCTNQGIILYKTHFPFLSYPQPSVISNPENNTTRRAIIENADKKIIFVSYGQINEYDPEKETIKLFSTTKLDGYSAFILKDNFWLGSDGTGLYKINLSKRKQESDYSYIKKFNESAMHVTCISKYNDSTLLFGQLGSSCNLKLYHINQKSYSEFLIKGWSQSKLQEKVTAIVEDKGSKWICSNAGLFKLINGNEVSIYLSKKELETNVVNYVYPVDEQIIWIATDVGLIKYDLIRKKIVQKLTEQNGLAGNLCISILPDNHKTIWVPTFRGLSRIDLTNGHIWNYYMQDGFTDNEYNYSSYLKASDGDIYLGGLNGFVRIRSAPPRTTEYTKTTLKLDQVVLYKKNGEEVLDINKMNGLKIHESDDRLSVSFTINEHLSPEFVRYFYKINELHNDWISLDRQNKIDLAYLPSGNYTLNIKSTKSENKNEFYQLSIPLMVYSYWYETKVFYFVVSLIVILSIISLFYNRYNTIRELEKIRTSLANDIHDEIGTMLTRSIMRLELLKRKSPIDIEGVSKVERQLRNTVQSFRNVLWSLNTDNVRTDDFVGRLNALLEDTFEGTHFGFLVTNLSPDHYFQKSIHIKRNLLLIVKELAHNAIKHSKGDFFEIVISNDGRKWKILVADNGKNDNFEIPQSGIGMSSLSKRVASINGTIDIDKRENGFFVTIFL